MNGNRDGVVFCVDGLFRMDKTFLIICLMVFSFFLLADLLTYFFFPFSLCACGCGWEWTGMELLFYVLMFMIWRNLFGGIFGLCNGSGNGSGS